MKAAKFMKSQKQLITLKPNKKLSINGDMKTAQEKSYQ